MIVGLALFVVAVLFAVLPGPVAGPLSWVLLGYVLYRAYPAVRGDLRALRLGSRRTLARRRSGGGAHL